MRGGNFKSFGEVSQKQKLTIRVLAWPNGAQIGCRRCEKYANKTPEQMERYLTKWPRCPKCGEYASVKPL